MNFGEWVLQCLGVWESGTYLDKLAENFKSDALENEEDMVEEIRICMECERKALGNQIAARIFDDTIERAVEELGAKEEDFDYYTNGTLDTWITCKGVIVTSWEEIEKAYNDNENGGGLDV